MGLYTAYFGNFVYMKTKSVSNKFLIVIVGPTGIGKTDLAIALAQSLQTEIISADSRQLYQGMCIGTAQPSEHQLSIVQHHFINYLSLETPYSAGLFGQEALRLIEDLLHTYQTLILVGGSGLYIKAVCDGLDTMPAIPLDLRDNLNNRLKAEGIDLLAKELSIVDPVYYQQVDLHNPQRIIRALEISITTGKPYSDFRRDNHYAITRPFQTIIIGLDMERKMLYERINQRVDTMMKDGLYQEAMALYPYRSYNSLQTVGYQEIFQHMEAKHTLEEAIELMKRNSRRYAKRQLTWFRKQAGISWFHPTELTAIMQHIKASLKP